MAQSVVKPVSVPSEPGETHLRNISQLTNGGENAEAYFSHDGQQLIFQSTRDGRTCDQQYVMRTDGSHVHRVSTGRGKTTCGYFMDGDRRILFASSEALERDCPPRPDPSKGYVWRLDPFDIYTSRPDGTGLRRLTRFGVYTAEADRLGAIWSAFQSLPQRRIAGPAWSHRHRGARVPASRSSCRSS